MENQIPLIENCEKLPVAEQPPPPGCIYLVIAFDGQWKRWSVRAHDYENLRAAETFASRLPSRWCHARIVKVDLP